MNSQASVQSMQSRRTQAECDISLPKTAQMVEDIRRQLTKQEQYLLGCSKPLAQLDVSVFVGPEYY
jgi:hypothetical protein